jgi:hypothetical protein
MKRKNQAAFDGYLKQAVEDIVRVRISDRDFQNARMIADKIPANTMQRRIELIASAYGR